MFPFPNTERVTEDSPLTHACPECGHVDAVRRSLTLNFNYMTVECRCQTCDETWSVHVDAEPSLSRSSWPD